VDDLALIFSAVRLKKLRKRENSVEIECLGEQEDAETVSRKAASFYGARGIDGVIYDSPERENLSSLAWVDRQVRAESPSLVHFGMEFDVLKSTVKIYFRNAKEHGIELYSGVPTERHPLPIACLQVGGGCGVKCVIFEKNKAGIYRVVIEFGFFVGWVFLLRTGRL
jgi:hypothetical protein